MAGDKYLKIASGVVGEQAAAQSSAGAGNAGDIVALDAAGLLDITMMPAGVGANTKTLAASEALSAGDFVNVWDDSSTPKMRKADGSAAGKEANGFVLAAVESAAEGTCYLTGVNNQLTGLTGGTVYYLSEATPGAATGTAPSTATNIVQRLGKAVSATELSFEPSDPITLA